MISVTLNIEVECDRCGSALETKYDGEVLSVAPCVACMEEEWDKGYSQCEDDLAGTKLRKTEKFTTETPMFEHDCESCIFLGGGSVNGSPEVWYDYYYCERGGRPTVIARYGNDGPDYLSGIYRIIIEPALAEAYHRAVKAGLIK